MEQKGFIRDMMDVKVLILYVAARLQSPASVQELYELCYQDDCLSYFDLCTAIPDLTDSGHLQRLAGDQYVITEKGRENGSITEDSIAFPVKERARRAVEQFNRDVLRRERIQTEILPGEDGNFTVKMSLRDQRGPLMQLELLAPSQAQAVQISRSFRANGEMIYNLILSDLLEEEA